jgi:hypothetical protein
MKKRISLLTAKEKSEKLQASMYRLVGNDAFQEFIDQVRELQRNAILDMINDTVARDERLSLAAIGEIRAYETIAGLYEDFVQRNVERSDEQS